MENSSFFERNKAYIFTLVGLGLVGFVFVNFFMIMDWEYLFKYTIHVLTGGGLDGAITAPDSTYKAMVNAAFGPNYEAIAPEIIRASNERQEYIWWVFVAEIAIFCVMYAINGRQEAHITRPNAKYDKYKTASYIVPMCPSCNGQNGQTFTAKNNTTFVWANVSKTCGQKR